MEQKTTTWSFKLLDQVRFKTQKKEDEPFVIYARAVIEESKGVHFAYYVKNSKASHALVNQELLEVL